MGTKVNSNYEDLLTFTRASKGHALRPVSYGDELVTNGDFSSSDGWTLKSNTTISGGQLTIDTTSDSSFYSNALRSDIDIVAGKIYYYEVDIESQTPSDQLWVYIGGGSVTADAIPLEGTGVITGVHIPTKSTSTLKVEDRHNTTSVHVINSISIKEVTFDQTDGTLTLFEHPDNIPRVEWDADRNRLGLLVEESRTNLFANSEIIDSTLTGSSGVLTPSDVVVNEGVYQGTWREITESTTTGQHRLLGGNVATLSAGSYTTLSCLVKRIRGSRSVQLLVYNGGDNYLADFNLDTETATISKGGSGTAGTASIENLGSGVYRLSASGIMSSTLTQHGIIWRLTDGSSSTYEGDGVSSVAVTAMMFEQGSFRTSYIKSNSGSTTTRSADVASIPVADFGYNADAGSLLAEAKLLIKDVSYKTVANLNTNGSNRIRIISSSSVDVIQAEITDGGANQLSLSESITEGSAFKGIIAYKENNSSSSVNGSVEAIDTACTIPAVTKLDIMTGMTGHIKSIKYYPRRLTNAQLVELTS